MENGSEQQRPPERIHQWDRWDRWFLSLRWRDRIPVILTADLPLPPGMFERPCGFRRRFRASPTSDRHGPGTVIALIPEF